MHFEEIAGAARWRGIGPQRGGRTVAVAGDPHQKQVFYFGACAGGIWKTTSGGLHWDNVSDGFIKTSSVGAVAVASADSNVVYAGMGESCVRSNVSHGDGVYRSEDGGRSWWHCGLEDTRHIARVRVDPRDPDLVYVGALGHIFGDNDTRGVFRSRNGGKTWERVLQCGPRSGASDLVLDPLNPRVVFAGMWQARRSPWGFSSGGPDGGLFRSTDEGNTWLDLTKHARGLPRAMTGRIGVAASAAREGRVWAIIEAIEGGGIYRSDDHGDSWILVNDDRDPRQRPWYFHHLTADPTDGDTIYAMSVDTWRSDNGGRTFDYVAAPHLDCHDLWIDPQDGSRMIIATDGGAAVSFDHGLSWSSISNQATAQMYTVVTDAQSPYRVYGTQQDATSISVPSRSHVGVITSQDWADFGGGESGTVALNPDDPTFIYCGLYTGILHRYDHRNKRLTDITVWPVSSDGQAAADQVYRFNWTFPLLLSPHDPGGAMAPGTLYAGANTVFQSHDRGQSWREISPDLTRGDPATLGPSGGPITADMSSTEVYGTVFALAESPLEAGLLWAGSDDGLVHVRRPNHDWQRLSIPQLPEFALISWIEASPHDAGTAYLAATRYKLDDETPYVYTTKDYGISWRRIDGSLPRAAITRVVREDPARAGLLYLGTETGVWVSPNSGDSWHSLQGTLPVSPIYGLSIREGDLIAGTHGRSFWILDDLEPVRQAAALTKNNRDKVVLFTPRDRAQLLNRPGIESPANFTKGRNYRNFGGQAIAYIRDAAGRMTFPDNGTNPDDGIVVWFWLDGPADFATLTFLDEHGVTVAERRISANPGLNRFVWDTRYPSVTPLPRDMTSHKALDGPLAAPGSYTVKLEVGGCRVVDRFSIMKDPQVDCSNEDLIEQRDLLLRIRDALDLAHRTEIQIRLVKDQLTRARERIAASAPAKQLSEQLDKTAADLQVIEDRLFEYRNVSLRDTHKYPMRVNGKLAYLRRTVATNAGKPTAQSYAVFEDLSRQLQSCAADFEQLRTSRLSALHEAALAAGLRFFD